MISLFKYISARRRLVESNRTIDQMGGKEHCHPFLLAQNEMISNEVTYFYYRFWAEIMYTLLLSAFGFIIYVFYITGEFYVPIR